MVRKLTLVLTVEEMAKLKQESRSNLRSPRDHARYLLRKELGLGPPNDLSVKHEDAALDDSPAGVLAEDQF